jgi:uncharacterized protein YndB with AHSA1/START domain
MNLTEVTVSRTIPAPAEKIFDVWMDKSSPGGPWFGADRVILNPVVDGLFYFAVKHEGRTRPHLAALWPLPAGQSPSSGRIHLDVRSHQGR